MAKREERKAGEREHDPMYANMTEEEFEGFLEEALTWFADTEDAPPPRIVNFGRAGVLTNNRGLVVTIGDARFQVTVVRAN